GNYGFAFNNAGVLTVNPKALTITANDAAQTYNGVLFSGGNGGIYNGFVKGQKASGLSGAVAFCGQFPGALDARTPTNIPQTRNPIQPSRQTSRPQTTQQITPLGR